VDPNNYTNALDAADALPDIAPGAGAGGQQMPAAQQPDDDSGWLTGGTFAVKSQAEWDALPPERKEVVRAAVAMGGALPLKDAMDVYTQARKQQLEAMPQEVPLPNGRKVYKIGNQFYDPIDSDKKALELQKALQDRDVEMQQENEKKVFLDRLSEYRTWIKEGGIVGPGADVRQKVDSLVNPDAYTKRWKLGTVIGQQVLENIKKLGSNPTEGERAFVLSMQPKISDPSAVWDEYLNTLEGMVGRRAAAVNKSNGLIGNNSANGSNVGTTNGSPAVADPVTPSAPAYNSPADVKAAYKAGKISRDEAVRAISGMGGR
jgi:hypothetical protein